MMWLNRSTSMNWVTSTVPAHADLGEVVAGQVHQHQVLGAFLLVGQEFLGQRLVRLDGLAAGPGSGDGVGDDFLAGDRDQRLR